MRLRAILSGVGGGIALYGLLYYPCYHWLPGQYIHSWEPANTDFTLVCLFASVIVLIVVGFLGGRWSSFDQKWSFIGGAAVGAIAAIIAYGLIIAPATGVIGNKEILRFGLVKVEDDISLAWLILYGVSGTLWWGTISFWSCLAIGLLLGGIGGWMAVPVPDTEQRWANFFPLIDPIMMFVSGMVNFIMYAAFNPLLEATLTAATKSNFTSQYPFVVSLTLINLTGFAWFLFWQFKLWADLRKYQTLFAQQRLSWALSSFASLGMPTLYFLEGVFAARDDMFILLTSLLSFIVAVLTFRDTFWKRRALPMPAIQNPLADLRFIITFALMLSLFMTMTIMTSSLTTGLNLVTITVTAIEPLQNGFSAASSTFSEMFDLTYSLSRSIIGTVFTVNGIYLFMVLWTLRNTYRFLREFGPQVFSRKGQITQSSAEQTD